MSNHGDWDWRPADDRLGDATEQDTGDAIPAVAPDDDVSDVVVLGKLDDGTRGATDHRIGPDIDAVIGSTLGDVSEDRLGAFLGGPEPVFSRCWPPGGGALNRVHDVQRRNPIVAEPFERVVESGLGRLRPVRGNEYLHVSWYRANTYKAGRPFSDRGDPRGMYDAVPSLVDRTVRVATFPDGSIDTYQRVRANDGEWLSKDAFREAITGRRSQEFHLDIHAIEAGGQAVNAAEQAHALGDDVRLDGCLDDDRLEFPFETHSVGVPSSVSVHEFSDGDITYADISDDVAGWSHADFETVPEADAYVCGNWASVDAMTDSLSALAETLEGRIFVFDPGDLTTAPAAEIRDCITALARLDDAVDVAISVNSRELAAIADALSVENEVEAVRAKADVFAVVRHEAEAAAAATRAVEVVVENIDADGPVRRTGGGDRFSSGLAHGLAASGEIGSAIALGNCCASYYVTKGTTGGADDIAALASEYA